MILAAIDQLGWRKVVNKPGVDWVFLSACLSTKGCPVSQEFIYLCDFLHRNEYFHHSIIGNFLKFPGTRIR
jgi:hypothetical protein